jgi:hypothetical protein
MQEMTGGRRRIEAMQMRREPDCGAVQVLRSLHQEKPFGYEAFADQCDRTIR